MAKNKNGKTRLKKGERNRLRDARKGIHQPPHRRIPRRRDQSVDQSHARELTQHFVSELETEAPKLAESVSRLNLEDLITFLMFSSVFHDPNDYDEARDTGYQPSVEFLVQLRLRTSTSEGTRMSEDAESFVSAFESAKKLQFLSLFSAYGPCFNEEGNPVAITEQQVSEQMIGRIRGSQLMERSPTYHHFGWDFLRGLFSKFDKQIEQVTGFTIGDCEGFGQAIERATIENRDARRNEIEALADVLRPDLEMRSKSDPQMSEFRRQSQADQDERLNMGARLLADMELQDSEGCPFKFTPTQLANLSSLSISKIELMLRFFRLGLETFLSPSIAIPLTGHCVPDL